jgi:hypothetical protein
MFVRKKKNSSGSISVQILRKKKGRKNGGMFDEHEIEKLEYKAKNELKNSSRKNDWIFSLQKKKRLPSKIASTPCQNGRAGAYFGYSISVLEGSMKNFFVTLSFHVLLRVRGFESLSAHHFLLPIIRMKKIPKKILGSFDGRDCGSSDELFYVVYRFHNKLRICGRISFRMAKSILF